MSHSRESWWTMLSGPRTLTVPCVVEIEHSFDSLHAHAIPEAVVLRPGDRVVVHGAPTEVGFGESARVSTTATVFRAGPLTRLWTELAAFAELTELFHCGFEPKEHAA